MLLFILNYNNFTSYFVIGFHRAHRGNNFALCYRHHIGSISTRNRGYHMVFRQLMCLVPTRPRHNGCVYHNVNFERRVLCLTTQVRVPLQGIVLARNFFNALKRTLFHSCALSHFLRCIGHRAQIGPYIRGMGRGTIAHSSGQEGNTCAVLCGILYVAIPGVNSI